MASSEGTRRCFFFNRALARIELALTDFVRKEAHRDGPPKLNVSLQCPLSSQPQEALDPKEHSVALTALKRKGWTRGSVSSEKSSWSKLLDRESAIVMNNPLTLLTRASSAFIVI